MNTDTFKGNVDMIELGFRVLNEPVAASVRDLLSMKLGWEC